jgi:hypothetical protein
MLPSKDYHWRPGNGPGRADRGGPAAFLVFFWIWLRRKGPVLGAGGNGGFAVVIAAAAILVLRWPLVYLLALADAVAGHPRQKGCAWGRACYCPRFRRHRAGTPAARLRACAAKPPHDPMTKLPPTRGTLTPNRPLADLTWLRVGGPADWLFQPADQDDLAAFLRALDPGLPVFPIGVGSNLIVRDGGIRGW